jgi:hypothetical protein
MPIGLTSCVRDASVSDLRALYKRWYVPQLMTLYLVGPFGEGGDAAGGSSDDRYSDVVALISALFGPEERGALATLPPTTTLPDVQLEDGSTGLTLLTPHPGAPATDALLRHVIDRPPPTPLVIAQSPQLTRVSLSLNLKRQLQPDYRIATRRELAAVVSDMVLAHVFDSRVSALRNTFDAPPFSGIGWDDGPAPEEGCALRGLYVTADVPSRDAEAAEGDAAKGKSMGKGKGKGKGKGADKTPRWLQAITIAFREALRLARFGVPPGELAIAIASCVKEFRDAAAAEASIGEGMRMGRVVTAPHCDPPRLVRTLWPAST